jgi:hypothetical protein
VSGPGDDPILDEYLKRGTEVSRRYRELDSDGVPPELDRRVLDEARAAVSKSRRWMRWSAPIALAASAVLVVSIVLETGVDKDAVGTLSAPMQTEAKSARPEAASESPARASELDDLAPRSDRSSRDEPVDHEESFEARRNSAPLIAGEANPPVMVVPVRPDSVQPVEAEPTAAVAAPSSPPAAAPPRVVMEERIAVAREASQADPAKAETEAPEGSDESDLVSVTAQRAADAVKEAEVVEVQARARAESRVEPKSNSARAVATTQAIALPNAEQWLESIRQLRRDGKTAEADREWTRFREVFPDYPVAEADKARTPTERAQPR